MANNDRPFFDLDPANLVEHWIEQPRLVERYAIQMADATKARDELKAKIELVDAEIEQNIRNSPGDYGLEKVTEAAVKSAIPLQKEHTRAFKRYLEAKYKVDVLGGVLNALEHRKRALEKLVDLHGQSYFATPRASKAQAAKIEQQTERKVRNKLKGYRK